LFKIGRDVSTFVVLEKQAELARQAAHSFKSMITDLGNISVHVKELARIEHEGDKLTHKLQDDVASHFITPLDKEDLRALSQALDDITDSIEALGARMAIYRVETAREELMPLSDLLVECTGVVVSAVGEMKTGFGSESFHQKLEKIHALENQSDDLFRESLGRLFFDKSVDPIHVMVWKELFDRIEVSMDICENVAKVLGTISVKYA
jgi:predicted phosphate transport protein (TIGR00153 family)